MTKVKKFKIIMNDDRESCVNHESFDNLLPEAKIKDYIINELGRKPEEVFYSSIENANKAYTSLYFMADDVHGEFKDKYQFKARTSTSGNPVLVVNLTESEATIFKLTHPNVLEFSEYTEEVKPIKILLKKYQTLVWPFTDGVLMLDELDRKFCGNIPLVGTYGLKTPSLVMHTLSEQDGKIFGSDVSFQAKKDYGDGIFDIVAEIDSGTDSKINEIIEYFGDQAENLDKGEEWRIVDIKDYKFDEVTVSATAQEYIDSILADYHQSSITRFKVSKIAAELLKNGNFNILNDEIEATFKILKEQEKEFLKNDSPLIYDAEQTIVKVKTNLSRFNEIQAYFAGL